jgi:hypothetical protein
VISLLKSYHSKFEGTVQLVSTQPPKENPPELREPTIVENFNWINWHLPTIILPSLVELNKIIQDNFDAAKSSPLFKEFIEQQSRFVASPNFDSYLKSKAEMQKLIPVDIKVNFEQEFALRDLYPRIISRIINSS